MDNAILPVIFAYSHFLAVIFLFSALVVEYNLISPTMDIEKVRRLVKVDLLYGISAGVVLLAGIARVFFEKGPDYYSDNPIFLVKVTLYLVIGLLSIFPTLTFLKWRKQLAAEQLVPLTDNGIEQEKIRAIMMIIRIQLCLLCLLPLFAVTMSKGFNSF